MKNSTKMTLKLPKSSSAEAKRWARELAEEFQIRDAAGRMLLGVIVEAFDDMRAAQTILEKDGQIITDRWGQKKQHPAWLNLRDARNQLTRAVKQLNVDIEPPAGPGTRGESDAIS